jgi:hypothetical protein
MFYSKIRNQKVPYLTTLHLLFWCHFFLMPLPGNAQLVGETSRLTVGLAGAESNGSSIRSAISPSGSLVAFESAAQNLVPQDKNNAADIFIASTTNGKILRSSVGRRFVESNGPSSAPRVSAQTPNGSYVIVYESDASNLSRNRKTPDQNGFQDIYATVFPSRFTFKVSRGVDNSSTNGRSEAPDIALLAEPNRLFIVYSSKATNIVSDDTNAYFDIFLSRITLPSELSESLEPESRIITTRISRSAAGNSETDGDSTAPRISGDGSTIVFESEATNLVQGITTQGKQIFLYDLKSGAISLLSRGLDGQPGNANSRSPAINYNGRFISFLSLATNISFDGLTPPAPTYQVFRHDVRNSGRNQRVNVTPLGAAGNSQNPVGMSVDIDASGRFVIFSDRADNLSDDTNSVSDIFIKDMDTSILERVSRNKSGASPSAASFFPSLNRSSFTALTGIATYASAADDIVDQDLSSNTDIFRVSLSFPELPVSPQTILNVPPDIAISAGTAKLSLEKFSRATTSELHSSAALKQISSTRTTPRASYLISYNREDSNGRTINRSKLLAKRNTATIRNLRPGTYSVSYQVLINSNGRVTGKTKPSPRQRFTVD